MASIFNLCCGITSIVAETIVTVDGSLTLNIASVDTEFKAGDSTEGTSTNPIAMFGSNDLMDATKVDLIIPTLYKDGESDPFYTVTFKDVTLNGSVINYTSIQVVDSSAISIPATTLVGTPNVTIINTTCPIVTLAATLESA